MLQRTQRSLAWQSAVDPCCWYLFVPFCSVADWSSSLHFSSGRMFDDYDAERGGYLPFLHEDRGVRSSKNEEIRTTPLFSLLVKHTIDKPGTSVPRRSGEASRNEVLVLTMPHLRFWSLTQLVVTIQQPRLAPFQPCLNMVFSAFTSEIARISTQTSRSCSISTHLTQLSYVALKAVARVIP